MKRFLSLLLLALASLLLTSASAPAQDIVSTDKVRRVLSLAGSSALKEVPTTTLINGALDGMRRELVRQGRNADYLAPVTEGTADEQAMAMLEAALARAARENPGVKAEDAAVSGALGSLKDPYAAYLDPTAYRLLKDTMEGEGFGGTGLFAANEKTKDGKESLLILEMTQGSPAQRAGLLGGDYIVAIDGTPVEKLGRREARDRLRGLPGSVLKLTVLRPDEGRRFDVAMTREETRVPAVSSELLQHEGRKVGYMKVWVFGSSTADEVAAVLTTLEKAGAESLVLDLRNNGGGYVSAAISISSNFLPKDSRIVSVEERSIPPRIYRTRTDGQHRLPLVVLLNEWSASASEITAGALRDHGVATLVGAKSYGKGSVQKIVPMGDKSAVKLTTAHYRTPSGRDINGVGIAPDVEVRMALRHIGTARDAQLQQALQRLVGGAKAAAR